MSFKVSIRIPLTVAPVPNPSNSSLLKTILHNKNSFSILSFGIRPFKSWLIAISTPLINALPSPILVEVITVPARIRFEALFFRPSSVIKSSVELI